MSAKMSLRDDMVSVDVQGKLGYACWKELRRAREEALSRKLPLHVDVSCCDGGEMGGLGSLLIAQETLGDISLHGCCEKFRRWFKSIGFCQHCQGDCGKAQPATTTHP